MLRNRRTRRFKRLSRSKKASRIELIKENYLLRQLAKHLLPYAHKAAHQRLQDTGDDNGLFWCKEAESTLKKKRLK